MVAFFKIGYLYEPPGALRHGEEIGLRALLTPLGKEFVKERMRMESMR